MDQITLKEHIFHLSGHIQCFNEFLKLIEDTETVARYSPINGNSALNLFTNLMQATNLVKLYQQLKKNSSEGKSFSLAENG